ncbi:NADH-quinone oxidoreductase subunit B [Desulfoscipio sp. XC116]|uniref:NADH-quinone oxidoreductase subunit B n=1 Tax=Desulfoscipio sp. XC116 TaxID=3144975 RepID=UPI00325A52AE
MEVTKDTHPVEEMTNNPVVIDQVKRLVYIAPLEKLLNIGRAHSLWPLGFGLACCAFESLMGANMPRFDQSRFGYEAIWGSARHADVMVVCGTVTRKAAPFVIRLYEQMAEPKWVMAVGSCAISGGPFVDSYHVVPGVDKLIPVDVYVPGCPPRPEAVLEAWLMIKQKILTPKVVSQVRG